MKHTIEEMFEVSSPRKMEKLAAKITGKKKECEKCLLIATILFMKEFCPKSDRNEENVPKFIIGFIQTDFSSRRRNDFVKMDEMFKMVKEVNPCSCAYSYYKAFRAFPENMCHQSVGNLFYKLMSKRDSFLTFRTDKKDDETDDVPEMVEPDVMTATGDTDNA